MNPNIKTAASLLRKASYDLQYRAKALKIDENNAHRHLDQEERKIQSDLWATGAQMAAITDSDSNSSYLVKRTYDLYKRKKQIESDTAKKVSAEESEIRSLQSQARKLDELAHTLEMGSW